MRLQSIFTVVLLLLVTVSAEARPREFLKKSDDWFASDEARHICNNILSFQSELGGWPKNKDTTSVRYAGDRSKLKATYDNGATTDELRFLARMFTATTDNTDRMAFERGLDYVLNGQYQNGGWPQFWPPGKNYHRHITYNDDAMVRLLDFVREVATSPLFNFVDSPRRNAASDAFKRGIGCILRCQISVNGTLTGWCAQHDEVNFRPQSARSYELATLSGAESVGITRLLMSIEKPSPEIVRSVDAAIAWLETVKLTGIRIARQNDPDEPGGFNKVVVNAPTAPPLWARFYNIQTNAAVFADRDGIPRSRLADIGPERRNGYAWYGTWAHKLMNGEYQLWKQQIALSTSE